MSLFEQVARGKRRGGEWGGKGKKAGRVERGRVSQKFLGLQVTVLV